MYISSLVVLLQNLQYNLQWFVVNDQETHFTGLNVRFYSDYMIVIFVVKPKKTSDVNR